MILAQRIQKMEESSTMAMAQKATELQEKGVNVIKLNLGETDFFTPDSVKEAAKIAVDNNFSFYPPNTGYLDLRQAIVNKLESENNLNYAPSDIIVTSGAKHALANVTQCLIEEGDEAVLCIPYWVTYSALTEYAGGKPVFIKASIDNDFKITPEQLDEALNEKTKAFFLCNPNNPTGSVYTKNDLSALVKVLEKYPNVTIISDEIYEHIYYGDQPVSIATFPTVSDRVIIINGVSKAYAMTGYRIGYLVSKNKELIEACNKLQGQFTSAASSIAQKASVEALSLKTDEVEKMKEHFTRRRNLIVSLLQDIDGLKISIPEGAFYVFFDVTSFFGKSDGTTTIKDADDLTLYLLSEAHVAGVSGSGFGDSDCIRLSYAASDEQISEAISRIKVALSKLN